MFQSHPDQGSHALSQPRVRTAESIAFEDGWKIARGAAPVASRDAIGLKQFAKFAAQMAIIEPDPKSQLLPFRLSGSGFFDLLGFEVTGMDYLDLVDPAIKEGAHACVMACLQKPCGLWQYTPVQTEDGDEAWFEYTILPIAKNAAEADHILVFVSRQNRPGKDVPTVKRIEHSTVWQWIDLGFGVPDMAL